MPVGGITSQPLDFLCTFLITNAWPDLACLGRLKIIHENYIEYTNTLFSNKETPGSITIATQRRLNLKK